MDEIKSNWKYYQVSSIEQQQKDWASSVKQICIVKTVPELLYTLDQTEIAGLENFLDLSFFRQNIAPMWEDPNNVTGGRIIVEIPTALKEKLHGLWKKTVVFCILEPFKGINGCVYAEKANYRICIWISDPTSAEDITHAWKRILDCDELSFSFSLHAKHTEPSKSKKKPFSSRRDR
ncbi:uncharacterized protein VICG_00660 [Vittaforma corneae ATCC 50505]|uniref:Uncharacterized protein n=1 Tax=Vittaforma corneae (strain ATCC 50505) TaxID=993615 RepID=L2GN55_VITCO|nr:uncharacterized protein VICG_00660 [Vittaforma corneae ATCC 50505]ELA42261.1 hypothetical protein VICG_00660 [Vittaforma corneae ATCC 50505]